MNIKEILNHPVTQTFGNNMYHSGRKDGCQDAFILMLWILHERYGWKNVLSDITDEASDFISDYMKGNKTNVKIEEMKTVLKEECGITFERWE